MPRKRNKLADAGRVAAQRLYPTLPACEGCASVPATNRHHKNGDATDNRRENLAFLCSRCHRALHRKTHCLRGHLLPPFDAKRRGCRICALERTRFYYRLGREAADR